MTEFSSVPLSALQHLLYCPRQCALIHVEREWAENRFTAEGKILHTRTDEGRGTTGRGIRTARSLPVRDERRGIHGICDVVEIHPDQRVIPIEYKRGRPKRHRADEVQLCAQALCLESMFGQAVERGFLFYGKERRRTEVVFDDTLRALTLKAIEATRAVLQAPSLPPAEYEAKKCQACSLFDICQPKAFRLKRPLREWFWRQAEAMEDFHSQI